jgi:hypothetical protein
MLIIANLVLSQQLSIMNQSVMSIKEVNSAPKSPWKNPYAERVIVCIRRDCLDHVVILNETYLRDILTEYLEYYYHDREHLWLIKIPFESPVQKKLRYGEVIDFPQVGGLHHRYEWREAA